MWSCYSRIFAHSRIDALAHWRMCKCTLCAQWRGQINQTLCTEADSAYSWVENTIDKRHWWTRTAEGSICKDWISRLGTMSRKKTYIHSFWAKTVENKISTRSWSAVRCLSNKSLSFTVRCWELAKIEGQALELRLKRWRLTVNVTRNSREVWSVSMKLYSNMLKIRNHYQMPHPLISSTF